MPSSSYHLYLHSLFFFLTHWNKPVPLFISSLLDYLLLCFFSHGHNFHRHHHLLICPEYQKWSEVSLISCLHHMFKYPSESHLYVNITLSLCLTFGISYLHSLPPNTEENCIPSPIARKHLPVGLQRWSSGQSWTTWPEVCLRAVLKSEGWGRGGVSDTLPLLC